MNQSSNGTVTIDRILLQRWMNVRKMTAMHVAERAGLAPEKVGALLTSARDSSDVEATLLDCLAMALDVPAASLRPPIAGQPEVIIRNAEELQRTRRRVDRDGHHFYNYYTLPAPEGTVAPVILDILCPASTLPKLNNGHLEPAITVNLGPGPIHGRWAEESSALSWQKLVASAAGDWIVGDSYLESSYRPHSYSLASDMPARIVSYTARSTISGIVEASRGWADDRRTSLVEHLQRFQRSGGDPGFAKRLHDVNSLGRACGLPAAAVTSALASSPDEVDLAVVRRIARAMAVDYRCLLPFEPTMDELGKRHLDVERSRATARRFRSYQVADMAQSPELCDLVGAFMRIEGVASVLDLDDQAGPRHYLVTGGEVVMNWRSGSTTHSRTLRPDDSAWIAPFVPHGFHGDGALIRLGSGDGLDDGSMLEAGRQFDSAGAAARAFRDNANWGHDDKGGKS